MENQLNLLKDLDKIIKLELINIPQENGNPQHFCILAEAAGGVTEKLSLISLDEVKNQLANLQEAKPLTLAAYCDNRNQFKLSTQAILKLPKHGSTIEVQREAIALNISRILGFNTTKSTVVEHEGKPALFVPFDDIQLLTDLAMGEEQYTFLPSSFSFNSIKKVGEKYLHYSTIVPVGNQLNSDKIINNFGHIMAFSYLCNDTDFIGTVNQNKAVKGCELYIFDQVVMSGDKMELDSRLNLIPVGVGKHLRHNQGRNRTLIEDSSFDSKFASIVNLLNHQQEINLMLDSVYFNHSAKINDLKTAIAPITYEVYSQPLQKRLEELLVLQDDVIALKNTVNNRIDSIFKNFPTLNGKAMNSQLFTSNQELIKHSLMLEKMVNKPVLFANDGRPYKNPWTYRNPNKIDSIVEKNDMIYLSFSKVDKAELISNLEKLTINPNKCQWNEFDNTLVIPFNELVKIHENKFFPEHSNFDLNQNYLKNFEQSCAAYPEKNRSLYIEAIDNYKIEEKGANKPEKLVNILNNLLNSIYNILPQTGNPGLLKHLQLTVQMHAQQQLRKILPEFDSKIAAAFEAAINLDRVKEFNSVLLSYAQNPHQNKDKVMGYLDGCVEHAEKAINYNQGKMESQTMQNESLSLISELNSKPESSVVAMNKLAANQKSQISIKDEDWEDDFVLITQESRRKEVESKLEEASLSPKKEEKQTSDKEEYTKKSTFKI